MLRRIYDGVMGAPWVYDRLRPLLLGGLDLGPFYASLDTSPQSVLLDVGCGTGNALDYLASFEKYVGFDTDEVAVRAARRRPIEGRNIRFEARICERSDVEAIDPSHVVLAGVLHHLDDTRAVDLLRTVTCGPRFERLCTLDIVLLPGRQHLISNTLARLDRGQHPRTEEGYRHLFRRADLDLRDELRLWNHPRRKVARYYTTRVSRRR